jgi:hypothetical protein
MRQSIAWIAGAAACLCACSPEHIVSGRVRDRHGEVRAGVVVRLIAIDDFGAEMAEFDRTFTGRDGRFEFQVPADPAMNIIVLAVLPDEVLRGFAFGLDIAASHINPFTEAMVRAVTHITAPAAGLSLLDLDPNTLGRMIGDLQQQDTTGVDTTDEAAVNAFVFGRVGRALAEMSGATVSVAASTEFETPTNESPLSFAATMRCATEEVHELMGASFVFDLTSDGQVCDGYNDFGGDAFDLAFSAAITSDTFVVGGEHNFPGDAGAAVLVNGDTLRLGPQALTSGVTLTRKIRVAATANIARYLEVLENPTEMAQAVSLRITGNLGSDLTTTLVVRGEGSDTLTPTDRFAATLDTNRYVATAGYVWQDNTGVSLSSLSFVGSTRPDLFAWDWQDVSLAPGETKTFVYYVLLAAQREPQALTDTLEKIADAPDMEGMSLRELMGLQNFAVSRGNIVGEPGAIVEGSSITITNQTQNVSVMTEARSDWGFLGLLPVAAGDQVMVTATDGFSQTFIAP